MAVTRADVAALAGVSPAVVSYVINGGPRPVSDRARRRVESAIEELGYRPNAIASALRGGRTRSIGLLTPSPRNPFFAEMAGLSGDVGAKELLERHVGALVEVDAGDDATLVDIDTPEAMAAFAAGDAA